MRRFLIIASACLLLGDTANAWEWPAQVRVDYRELGELGKAGEFSAMEKAILSSLPKWEALGGPWYGHLMLRAVQRLATDEFDESEKVKPLAMELARRALRRPGNLCIEDQVDLTLSLQMSLIKPWRQEDWVQKRGSDARLWLETWKRLDEVIDPDWVPEKTYWNMAPPGMPSATQPEDIEDPGLRAKFEAALAENERKAQRNSEQMRTRRLMKSFHPWAKRYLTKLYSHPPYAVDELEQLLKEYVADEQARSEILSSVTSAMEANR
ncbi:MAG TPA: hypothetical protein VLU25_09695 [Acidobacteriota bacterium]|nr:hypothetical protein [Acidobacteriota bacterium]